MYSKDRRPIDRTPPCYGRTCPVRISHPASSKSIEGLALIDDQAGVTFVDPMVGRSIDIPKASAVASTQAAITINGQSPPKPCQIIHGLIVTPLDGQPAVPLPRAIMQNPIPDALNQIPSKQEVANTVGFESFAKHFPEKNYSWPTLLLIGRDCVPIQWQHQFRAKNNPSQMVVETPLGWALVGSPDPNHLTSPPTRSDEGRTISVNLSQSEEAPLCIVHHKRNSDAHSTLDCLQFQQSTTLEKWKYVNKRRLCPPVPERKAPRMGLSSVGAPRQVYTLSIHPY